MLNKLKVLEFQGLAPSVFCGMYFADQGAEVVLIARPEPIPFSMQIHKNIMNRNKKCIALSLKNTDDRKILVDLIKTSDIIIDPHRPGVLQKQGLGPEKLYLINPKIILLRVTGYGQSGEMVLKPGHDLNYISSSGILKLINEQNNKIQFPANYLADFVSASLGILGTLKALSARTTSNSGSVVDCSLAGGCSYLTSLTQDDNIMKNKSKNYLIKYFELNGKRYIVSQYEKEGETFENEIKKGVQQMQMKNETFLKNSRFEIAEIRKVSKLKNSNLGNPFEWEKMDKKTKIPERDQNRQYILQWVQESNEKRRAKL